MSELVILNLIVSFLNFINSLHHRVTESTEIIKPDSIYWKSKPLARCIPLSLA